jgi:DNA-binding CsgD family transcriptional regulator
MRTSEPPEDDAHPIVTKLLATAAELHQAALDPARWPEVIRAARLRLALDRATDALSPEHAAWLESIMESATRVCAEVARLELARTITGSAADMLPVGLALLDARGRVLRANPEATRLLRSFLYAGRDPAAPGEDTTGGLVEVRELADVAQAAIEQQGGPPHVTLLARSAKPPIEALAVPVSGGPDALTFPDARAIVFLVDPDRLADVDEASLAPTFDLTAAEARLAARLLRGDTLQQAARALGVRTTTARTHLSRLFAKTNTSRQPELVKLLVLTSLSTPLRLPDATDR